MILLCVQVCVYVIVSVCVFMCEGVTSSCQVKKCEQCHKTERGVFN